MPAVPWIRLYQNWPRHRKTVALRKALGTAEPVLCLWLWAAENAPNGDLGGMTTEEIEDASMWKGKRGKAAAAMIDAGFIDRAEDGSMTLHNWEARAGKGVASLIRSRERSRDVMRNRRKNEAQNLAKTLSLSPDLGLSGSSPPEATPDPDARAGCTPGAKIRPRTAYDLEHCLRVAVQREQQTVWNPGNSFHAREAREFIEGFGDQLEEALATIEQRIALFAKDPAMRPWTVAKFAAAYNGIGQPKPTRDGKPAPMQARY